MGKLGYILFGVIFLAIAAWLAYTYPSHTLEPALHLLEGTFFLFLILFGISFFLIASAIWKIEKEKKRFTGFFSSVGFPKSPFQPPSSPEEELPPTISSDEYKEFVKEEKEEKKGDEKKEQPKKYKKK